MIDIIIGTHSIVEALNNPKRNIIKLLGTKESIDNLKKKLKLNCPLEIFNNHNFKQEAKKIYLKNGFSFKKITSNLLLLSNSLESLDISWLYNKCTDKLFKILCIDQVTDVHNIAAILRTSVFYGATAFLFSKKGAKNFSPSFFKIASGATEHIAIINVSSISKVLRKLQNQGIFCIGLSEYAENTDIRLNRRNKGVCLVLGSEDKGLSNAVSRAIGHKVAIKSKGAIKSLNVSIAAAIAMERFF